MSDELQQFDGGSKDETAEPSEPQRTQEPRSDDMDARTNGTTNGTPPANEAGNGSGTDARSLQRSLSEPTIRRDVYIPRTEQGRGTQHNSQPPTNIHSGKINSRPNGANREALRRALTNPTIRRDVFIPRTNSKPQPPASNGHAPPSSPAPSRVGEGRGALKRAIRSLTAQRNAFRSHATGAQRPTPPTPHPATNAETRAWHQGESLTHAIQKMLAAPERETQWHITGEHILAALLMATIFFIRISNLNFNTLHLDEAIYVSVGQDALARVYDQGATQWMFGSYMYPVAAAIADQVGGVVGLRAFSAVMTTLAALFVYLASLRMFGGHAALWSLLIFGLSGISINLGQHAVYDALAVPFLAASLLAVVSATYTEHRQRLYFLCGGATFALAVLAKYIAVAALPALIMTVVVIQLYQKRNFLHLTRRIAWPLFLIPLILIGGGYAIYYWNDLQIVLTGQFATQVEPRGEIALIIAREIGLPILFSIGGLVLLAQQSYRRFGPARRRLWQAFVVSLGLLLLAALLLPLYHLLAANERALSKHNVMSLVFLAPLAGYGVTQVIEYARAKRGSGGLVFRAAGAALTALSLFLFVNYAIQQNADFHRSWPNNSSVLQFLQTQNITPESRILSSSYAIYEYAYDMGTDDRDVWSNIWYAEYDGLMGEAAVERAIADCAYDIVILDNFYAPETAGYLESVLYNHGYAIAFSTMEELSDGVEIITNVHLPRTDGTCSNGSV